MGAGQPITIFGKVKKPCDDCWDGYCTMNCSGRVEIKDPEPPSPYAALRAQVLSDVAQACEIVSSDPRVSDPAASHALFTLCQRLNNVAEAVSRTGAGTQQNSPRCATCGAGLSRGRCISPTCLAARQSDRDFSPEIDTLAKVNLSNLADHRSTSDPLAKATQALVKLRSYNVDIREGRINYRPDDHIAVIDEVLSELSPRSGESHG